MKRTSFHLITKLSLLLVCTIIGLAQSTGIFTEAQAQRGQALYAAKCASCHGASLEGATASALSGSKFAGKWSGKSVDDLYFITRTQMPYGAGGSLTNQQYLDIVVSLLKGNGYTAGTRELTMDAATLKQLKIQPQGFSKDRALELPSTAQPAPKASQPSAKFPTQEELNAADSNSTDWLMSNHDYSGQRFVDLKQITPQNASTLRPTCLYQAGDTKPFHNNPVVYRGVMYTMNNGGRLSAIDAKTGKDLYELEAVGIGSVYASPVVANGHLYLCGLDKNVVVVKAGDSPDKVCSTKLDDRIAATPAIAGGTIYIRTAKTLYAFSEGK